MKLELQRFDWYEVLYNSSSTKCWGKFKEIINSLISKFVSLQKQTPKKNKSIWMNKLTLSKIKMKAELTIGSWKRKTNAITKCILNIKINRKTLAEKQSQIIKHPCREKWNLTQKAFLRYAKNELNFIIAITDLVDTVKILSDDTRKTKAFNMFFKSVFTEESDFFPDFNLN